MFSVEPIPGDNSQGLAPPLQDKKLHMEGKREKREQGLGKYNLCLEGLLFNPWQPTSMAALLDPWLNLPSLGETAGVKSLTSQ